MARFAHANPPDSQDASQSATQRAALYMRVSTRRQAESDLSIPDQRRQLAAFCEGRGWEVAAEFVDAGLSGTDDNLPQLQRLLEMATAGDAPFDAVIVYSFSRFARDHFALGIPCAEAPQARYSPHQHYAGSG